MAEFRSVEGVARGLGDVHVSGDGGDAQDFDLRRAQSHDQSYGVVGGGVCVDEELSFHAGRIANSEGNRFGGEFGRRLRSPDEYISSVLEFIPRLRTRMNEDQWPGTVAGGGEC